MDFKRKQTFDLQDWYTKKHQNIFQTYSNNLPNLFNELQVLYQGAMQELIRQIKQDCQEKSAFLEKIWGDNSFLTQQIVKVQKDFYQSQEKKDLIHMKNLSEFYNKYLDNSLGKSNKIESQFDQIYDENIKLKEENKYIRKKNIKLEQENKHIKDDYFYVKFDYDKINLEYEYLQDRLEQLHQDLRDLQWIEQQQQDDLNQKQQQILESKDNLIKNLKGVVELDPQQMNEDINNLDEINLQKQISQDKKENPNLKTVHKKKMAQIIKSQKLILSLMKQQENEQQDKEEQQLQDQIWQRNQQDGVVHLSTKETGTQYDTQYQDADCQADFQQINTETRKNQETEYEESIAQQVFDNRDLLYQLSTLFDQNNYPLLKNDKLRSLQYDLKISRDNTVNYLLLNLPSNLDKLKPIANIYEISIKLTQLLKQNQNQCQDQVMQIADLQMEIQKLKRKFLSRGLDVNRIKQQYLQETDHKKKQKQLLVSGLGGLLKGLDIIEDNALDNQASNSSDSSYISEAESIEGSKPISFFGGIIKKNKNKSSISNSNLGESKPKSPQKMNSVQIKTPQQKSSIQINLVDNTTPKNPKKNKTNMNKSSMGKSRQSKISTGIINKANTKQNSQKNINLQIPVQGTQIQGRLDTSATPKNQKHSNSFLNSSKRQSEANLSLSRTSSTKNDKPKLSFTINTASNSNTNKSPQKQNSLLSIFDQKNTSQSLYQNSQEKKEADGLFVLDKLDEKQKQKIKEFTNQAQFIINTAKSQNVFPKPNEKNEQALLKQIGQTYVEYKKSQKLGEPATIDLILYYQFFNRYGMKKIAEKKLYDFLIKLKKGQKNLKILQFSNQLNLIKSDKYPDYEHSEKDTDFYIDNFINLDENINKDINKVFQNMEAAKCTMNTVVETAKIVFQGILSQGNINSLIQNITYRQTFNINDILQEFTNIFRKSQIQKYQSYAPLFLAVCQINESYISFDHFLLLIKTLSFKFYEEIIRNKNQEFTFINNIKKKFQDKCDNYIEETQQMVMKKFRFAEFCLDTKLITKEDMAEFIDLNLHKKKFENKHIDTTHQLEDKITRISDIIGLWKKQLKKEVKLRFIKSNSYDEIFQEMFQKLDSILEKNKEDLQPIDAQIALFIFRILSDRSKHEFLEFHAQDCISEELIILQSNIHKTLQAKIEREENQ